MRLTKWNIKDIDNLSYRRTKNQEILEEFINSGMECAKVEGFTQPEAHHCAGSLNSTIKNSKMHGVKAISRKGEVFLLKVK